MWLLYNRIDLVIDALRDASNLSNIVRAHGHTLLKLHKEKKRKRIKSKGFLLGLQTNPAIILENCQFSIHSEGKIISWSKGEDLSSKLLTDKRNCPEQVCFYD